MESCFICLEDLDAETRSQAILACCKQTVHLACIIKNYEHHGMKCPHCRGPMDSQPDIMCIRGIINDDFEVMLHWNNSQMKLTINDYEPIHLVPPLANLKEVQLFWLYDYHFMIVSYSETEVHFQLYHNDTVINTWHIPLEYPVNHVSFRSLYRQDLYYEFCLEGDERIAYIWINQKDLKMINELPV